MPTASRLAVRQHELPRRERAAVCLRGEILHLPTQLNASSGDVAAFARSAPRAAARGNVARPAPQGPPVARLAG